MKVTDLNISRNIPITEVDVTVVGGGPAGFAAAASSSRNGNKTAIIERYGFFGGMMTAGYVVLLPLWLTGPLSPKKEPLIKGISDEFISTMVNMKAAIDPLEALDFADNGNDVIPAFPAWNIFDFEIAKIVIQDMLEKAGCKLWIHTKFVDVLKEKEEVKGIIVATKKGLEVIKSKVVIDATGDGDVAYMAGAEYQQDYKNPLPVTLCFYMSNIDVAKVEKYLERDPGYKNKLALSNIDFGKGLKEVPSNIATIYVNLPTDSIKKYQQVARKKDCEIWALHKTGINVADKNDFNSAELELRRKLKTICSFLIKEIPGFEDSYLSSVATQLGTRESRRISGKYRLTIDDAINGATFEDAICNSLAGGLSLEKIRKQKPFQIPYRCLLPDNLENLIVSGRCISIDQKTAKLFSPRDITTCMATGQAAGTAAAISVRKNISLSSININELKDNLVEQNVNLNIN